MPQKITPFLWFDSNAEEAADFYVSVFPNSEITEVSHYGEAGPRPAGSVMVVSFRLDGQEFLALNGGPEFTFNEAVSFLIDCQSQEEVDYYWNKLTDGGEPYSLSNLVTLCAGCHRENGARFFRERSAPPARWVAAKNRGK